MDLSRILLIGVTGFGALATSAAPRAKCHSGLCFHREAGRALLRPLAEGSEQGVSPGDALIGVGAETWIEITFDDGSRRSLYGSGLIRARPDPDL